MANEVSIFEGATNLPAYFNDLFGEESNVQTGVSIPSVSIRGKVFRIILDGNEKIITRVNPDTNEEEPASTFDVVVLDGEAVPAGGLGLCRELKNEIYNCPPIIVLTGRAQDAWLASWSLADVAITHPVDPVTFPDVVAAALRRRVGALPAR